MYATVLGELKCSHWLNSERVVFHVYVMLVEVDIMDICSSINTVINVLIFVSQVTKLCFEFIPA